MADRLLEEMACEVPVTSPCTPGTLRMPKPQQGPQKGVAHTSSSLGQVPLLLLQYGE